MSEVQVGGEMRTQHITLFNESLIQISFGIEPQGYYLTMPPKSKFVIEYEVDSIEDFEVIYLGDGITIYGPYGPKIYYESHEIHPENKHPSWRN